MIRAVVCDDEKAVLVIIRYFLETEKLPIQIVGTAENGRDAWNLIQREKPDLIFMDIHMPYMDGFEVIQKVKGSKIIIITAYDFFSYAQRALRLGVSDILTKPIDLKQLKQSVIRAIGWNFTDNEQVNTVLQYIYEHYNEEVELETLAGLTYCSVSHVSRLFKKHTGMTILSYIHKLRIEKSLELFEEEKHSLKEVAGMVGYNNLNNFYKHFKDCMGTTPALYLKQKKEQ